MSSDNPWPGYNEYHVDRDETDPEYRQELLGAFRAIGTKPEDIVTDDQLRADYAEYLKKNPQVEKDDEQAKP